MSKVIQWSKYLKIKKLFLANKKKQIKQYNITNCVPYINKRGYVSFSIHKKEIMLNLIKKIKELKLPILERKWNNIYVNK